MKKIKIPVCIPLTLVFALLLTMLTFAAAAESSEDYSYTVLDDGTAEITGYSGNSAALEIPSEIAGYRVTSIGYRAFYYCTNLESVIIPDSVTNIGFGAFYYCTNLESVAMCNGVTSIGSYAFFYCISLESVTIPDSVASIGGHAYFYCTSLESITVGEQNSNYCSIDGNLFNKEKTELIQYAIGKKASSYVIPDSVTSIGDNAFVSSTSLESVTIPAGVASIGNNAFEHCTSLKSIAIPDSVTSIGNKALYYCTGLKSVTIGKSVTAIGDNALVSCTSLESITVDEQNSNYCSIDGNLFNKEKNGLIQYAIGKNAPSYTVPDSVTSIGDHAFEDCTSLASITIPGSVTSIGDSAFKSCAGLEYVYYSGSEAEWQEIQINGGNEPLLSADIIYLKESEYTPGDVNSDGKVDSVDATLVLQFYAQIIGENTAGYNNSAADLNGDGDVTAADATLILQIYAGIA